MEEKINGKQLPSAPVHVELLHDEDAMARIRKANLPHANVPLDLDDNYPWVIVTGPDNEIFNEFASLAQAQNWLKRFGDLGPTGKVIMQRLTDGTLSDVLPAQDVL